VVVYFSTATNRRLRAVSWSIVALPFIPNGFAAGPDGSIYVSNFSVFPGVNADPVGQVVRVDN
jgi:hypothetical protein